MVLRTVSSSVALCSEGNLRHFRTVDCVWCVWSIPVFKKGFAVGQIAEGVTSELPFSARSQNCENGLLASLCLSVRPTVHLSALKNSAVTGRISSYLIFEYFSKICPRKLKLH